MGSVDAFRVWWQSHHDQWSMGDDARRCCLPINWLCALDYGDLFTDTYAISRQSISRNLKTCHKNHDWSVSYIHIHYRDDDTNPSWLYEHHDDPWWMLFWHRSDVDYCHSAHQNITTSPSEENRRRTVVSKIQPSGSQPDYQPTPEAWYASGIFCINASNHEIYAGSDRFFTVEVF